MKKSSDLSLPPGRSSLPLSGETIAFPTDRDFFDKRRVKYGSIPTLRPAEGLKVTLLQRKLR